MPGTFGGYPWDSAGWDSHPPVAVWPGGATPPATADPLSATMVALKQLLVNAGLFTPTSCVVSLNPEPFLSPAPPCCAITPGTFTAGVPELTGGGRYELVLDGEFTLNLVLRHASDITRQDYYFLVDPARGGYPMVLACISTLLEQFAYDSESVLVAVRGLKLTRIGTPRAYRTDPLLGLVPVVFAARVLVTLPFLA